MVNEYDVNKRPVTSTVGTVSTNKNKSLIFKSLILVINIVLWIFLPITFIGYLLYLSIVYIKSFIAVGKVVSSNLSSVYNLNSLDGNLTLNENITVSEAVSHVILTLSAVKQRLLKMKVCCLDSNLGRVEKDIINRIYCRIDKIIEKLDCGHSVELLKGVESELDSIMPDVRNIIDLTCNYSNWNLFSNCAEIIFDFLLDIEAKRVFLVCKKVTSLLIEQATTSSIDNPNVSGVTSIARGC